MISSAILKKSVSKPVFAKENTKNYEEMVEN